MGRAKATPNIVDTIRDIRRRLYQLEKSRRTREVLTPVAVSAAASLTPESGSVITHVIACNPTGSLVVVWVRCTVTGTNASVNLQLSWADDPATAQGATVGVTASGLVTASFRVPDGWTPGQVRLLNLTCWVTVGSATVLPVMSIIS